MDGFFYFCHMNTATQEFIASHLASDVNDLALRKAPIGVDMDLALRQIAARQLLKKKVPSWSENDNLLFPVHLSVEQCSSELTAAYKSGLMKGDTFVDLTGGLGVDCHFISQRFKKSDYVEIKPELCDLATHNFSVLKDQITVNNLTAESFLLHCQPIDCAFLDPARRDQYGRKTVSIADCTPNVVEMQDDLLQKAHRVMLKLSPMLDISKALGELHCVKEVHVLAVANECKELLFILERGFSGAVHFTCVNLSTEQSIVRFTMEEEIDSHLSLASGVSNYLYEPNAALMKAGCFKLLAQRYGVFKLHKNSNLYTADHLVSTFPGRVFEVVSCATYNKKVKQVLLSDVEKASLATRNFPLSVAELRKTLKLADGDETYVFATTIRGEEKVLIRTKKATL